jgi:hypothetical protein
MQKQQHPATVATSTIIPAYTTEGMARASTSSSAPAIVVNPDLCAVIRSSCLVKTNESTVVVFDITVVVFDIKVVFLLDLVYFVLYRVVIKWKVSEWK